jgi:N-acylneuraminate cytidylyltransferase
MPVVLPRYLVQDIDTPEDWKTAELMFESINGKRSRVKEEDA